MAQASGHNAYLPGYKKSHIANHSWRTAENSAQYLIPILQAKAKENPGLQLLDVGCGPGTISASFSKYMPNGTITATDLSADVLEQAAENAKSVGVQNVKFQTASIYELPFLDNCFDIVHASQVLCHLDAPVDAFKEMLRVCKPGGVVADREACMHMWSYWPQLPGLMKFHHALNLAMEAAGGSLTAGPQLLSWAIKAGVKREQVTVSFGTWSYSTMEEKLAWGKSACSVVSKPCWG